ncbi:hypothetical protein SAMN05421760_101216 [Neptunomonas antarctica]|uniref:Uncharacterized protein n=1 Tax=Neptunomonas antarctica TaxID=619304 RepID=A0A1N7IW29_9GAMM|nr:hypothetical protein SAMN05421760_101216 [Neptunomonas antarctica]
MMELGAAESGKAVLIKWSDKKVKLREANLPDFYNFKAELL